MFGLDPLSRPVAIVEILLLLALAAFIGWLLGRLVLAGRISALRASVADKKAELDECRRSKAMGVVDTVLVQPEPVVATLPAFVHADPLLPAFSNDDTPEFIDVEAVMPTVSPLPEEPVIEVAPMAAPIPEAPVFIQPIPFATGATGSSETDVLNRIAARADEINFDRIGRAVASEADDLKEIVGIGPFLERKLHSLGIYTFRQVSNFTKEDIDKVNDIIEFFPGRIERDNWVDQSKTFYDRKYGNRE